MIRIATFEDNSLIPFKTITEKSFTCLKADSEILKASYKQFVVFKFLQLNLKDYFQFISKSSNIPSNEINYGVVHNMNAVLEANRYVLNVLMSFKFFLDNADTYLKRKYGKESEVVNSYISLTRNFFDNSFAYRFLSKLRNFSAHLGFPFDVLNLDIKFNSENPEKSMCSLQILLDIEALKEEKDLFGSIVYKDLSSLSEDLDIVPLINELSSLIIKIQQNIYNAQKDFINESIENIEYFVGDRKTSNNQIKVYQNFIRVNNEVSFDVYDIPYDIINEYKKVYKDW